MPPHSEKPAIVLVQGAFQTALVYKALCTSLQSRGSHAVLPALPSCSDVENEDFPTRSLTDDAAVITKAIEQLVDEGKRVVVAMHSYGGIVGSEAIPESLSYTARQAQGLAGGVVHLFYYAAFVLKVGTTVLETFGESPNGDARDDGRFGIKNGAKTLYGDLPDAEATMWESRLIPQSYKVQSTPTTRAAYLYIPSTYLVCENDQAVPAEYQRMFAALAGAEVDTWNTGHSPMLSHTDMLVEKIVRIADRAVAAVGGG
ncbi:Alpha/beta hydrolase fold-1 [Aspergillus pseudoustus]|uniref:Alpha/beta hydrolase fold-1 n=1 Tax=Aspergillus pseudoustus TaxID=1810923 RepID=A0ABR4II50_9EURO